MFDTTKEDLKDLLRKVDDGKLQLPDFQRDYVWGDEDVRSLIASIAKGFPVGSLLTLETGGAVEFKPRLLAGVPTKDMTPVELLLDGQQRMTSLYQSMFSEEPVRTRTPRGTEIERHYFVDIQKSIDGSTELSDAIIGVPADKRVRTNFGKTVTLDLATRELEFEQDMFPLDRAFDSRSWFYDWRDYWRNRNRDVTDLDRDFFRGVIESIERYKMPIIRLDKSNSREAICLVFEKVNVGGKKLDAFELVTAIYAASSFDLREDWNGTHRPLKPGRRSRMVGAKKERDVLSEIASTDFLQACTLLHTREVRLAKIAGGAEGKEVPQVSCKREALLGLPLTAYEKYADSIEAGFIEAAAFLNELKIMWHKDVPYPPVIVGLAAVFAIAGNDAQTVKAKQQLSQWFWSVTLGELYGSTTDTRLANDVPELVEWIRASGSKPRSLDDALFQRDRLRTLRTRLSAAYKGMHALVMNRGCRDFITGRAAELMTFFNDKIDIHHIFPQDWCKRKGISASVFNSIVNKTPLSKKSNLAIGANAPSVYLKAIEQKQGLSSDELDDILRTHLIEPRYLREDDFASFFDSRISALSGLVADAMNKPVVEDRGVNEREVEIDPEGSFDEDVVLEAA